MKKKDKVFLLKTAKQMVARCTEYTPPHIKSSSLNYEVANVMLAIENLTKLIKK